MNKNTLLLAGAAVAAVTMIASIKSLVTVEVQRTPAPSKRKVPSSATRRSSSSSSSRRDDGYSYGFPMAAIASAFNSTSDYCASSSYSSSDSGSYSSSCDTSSGGF